MTKKIPVFLNIKNQDFYKPCLLWSEEHPDQPRRIKNILKEIRQADIGLEYEVADLDLELVKKVHSLKYINFLENLGSCITNDAYYFPTDFWHSKKHLSSNFMAKLGQFSFDSYTPVNKDIFSIICSSAAVAYGAAKMVLDNQKVAYGLTRPPGHHAMKSLMGGFCYLNNAAIAAQFLSKFGNIAILDLDFHHGNGTQEIFYNRDDVLTVSIHGHPDRQFPYHWGFEDEIGVDLGEGKNLNIALLSGIRDIEYDRALQKALDKIKNYNPKYLVISLGLDTYKMDPKGDFKLTTNYYGRMAKTIKSLNYPTVIIQEGGYHDDLGKNVVSFLNGFN